MGRKHGSSRTIRLVRGVCSSTLIIATLYIFFAGFDLLAGTAIALAVASVAAPIVVGGGGALEMAASFFEALLEGVTAIVEAIGDFLGGFSG